MGKNNVLSGVLVLIVILMIAIGTVMVVSYSTGVLNAAVGFASSDQLAKLQQCGVSVPVEFYKLRSDIPTLLVPAIYVGLPGMMVILSILMFIAGFYYGHGHEGSMSSETTTTTSAPNRNRSSGRYAAGRRVEQTRTRRSTRNQ